MNNLITENVSYAGFNLLLLAPTTETSEDVLSFSATYVTNSGGGGTIRARPLVISERQCGGLSNGVDGHGANEWPKIQVGTRAFQDIVQAISVDTPEDEITDKLFELLAYVSIRPHPRRSSVLLVLPPVDMNSSHHGKPVERSDYRNFIQIEPVRVSSRSPGAPDVYYGTRISTVILIRRDGRSLFIERDIWTLDGEKKVTKADAKKQRVFRLRLFDTGS